MIRPDKGYVVMRNDRRHEAAYNRSFYMAITAIFALVSTLSLLALLFQGVTELRLLVTFVSMWYLIYMMDLVERRFRRGSDNVVWRKLFRLRGKSETDTATTREDGQS